MTWATSVPILVFLGLSVLDLGLMYATDRQTDVRQHHRLMPPPRGGGLTKRFRKKYNVLQTQHVYAMRSDLFIYIVHKHTRPLSLCS